MKGVYKEIQDLCGILSKHVRQMNTALMPFTVISSDSTMDMGINQLDQSFMYSQLIKEILLEMEYTDQMKNCFIESCLVEYVENESALNIISEFERTYNPLSAIRWYTRECFLYSMLNRALRTQNLDVIFNMGFFIQDLHRQITQLYSEQNYKQILKVYRGQGIFNTEFTKIVRNKGGLISFNNFLSTTYDGALARVRAESAQDDPELTGVYFVIEIDPSTSKIPFASVNNVSYMDDSEQEVLFSTHTVFRTVDMIQILDNNRLWEVKLTSTNDNDEQLKCYADFLRTQNRGSTLARLGFLMLQMGELSKAEEFYKKTIKPSNMSTAGYNSWFHHNMGIIKTHSGDYQSALDHFNKARQSIIESHSIDFSRHAYLNNSIGTVYESIGDYSTALSYFENAIEIEKRWLPPNHYLFGQSHYNIGIVYQLIGKYTDSHSHFEQALEIWSHSLPSNHPDIAATHANISDLSIWSTKDHANMLIHGQEALNINQRVLPQNHYHQASSRNSLGMTFHSLGQYSTALDYYKEALNILEKSFHDNHPQLGILYNNISEIYRSIGDYQTAISYSLKALEIFQKCYSPNHPNIALAHFTIGSAYRCIGVYTDALSHYNKANDIWCKTLSSYIPQRALFHNNVGEI